MSLLLDALKRAEQEKLARGSGTGPAARPSAAAASLELQPMGSAPDLAAPGVTAHRADPGAHAAQTVFQAKSPGAPAGEPRSRAILWATLGAIAVVAAAAGGYVWYSINSLTPQYARAPQPRPAPAPAPASSPPLPPTAAMGAIVPPESAPAPVAATAAVAVPPAVAAVVAGPVAAPRPESAADRLAREGAAIAARPPLRMDRAPEAGRRVPSQVSSAYAALTRGDYATARRGYDAALASDPTSVDAHLGLATLDARMANRGAAADHYRRALDLDPRNATALAGLAALADFSRPEALEAQLRSDLARLPDSPALQFTLGNLLATQSRWSEAQAAYYEAHRLDPGSAEIAHNLAVSLDHLGQGRRAADFYARALESSRGRAAAFDTAAVARRLAELR